MQEIKVSVIVPMYNSEKYIERCINSIRNQTLKEIEIIIIDDESTDESNSICASLAEIDARVRLVRQKNTGQGLARNKGLELARGEYVAFMDSDDTIAPEMYEAMYQAASGVCADACLCGFSRVDTDGTEEPNPNPFGGKVFSGNEVIEEVLLNILGSKPDAASDFVLGLAVWKGLYSKEVIRKNSLKFRSEREVYSEDTLFNVEYFLRSQKVVMVEECFYKYWKNATSFTTVYKTDLHEKNVRFYQAVEECIRPLECYVEAKTRLQRLFLGFLRSYLQRIVGVYSLSEARIMIDSICNDPNVVAVMKEYPYKKNPWKQRLINQMIAGRNSLLIWLFIKMKNR